jgi:hypothetical protein
VTWLILLCIIAFFVYLAVRDPDKHEEELEEEEEVIEEHVPRYLSRYMRNKIKYYDKRKRR